MCAIRPLVTPRAATQAEAMRATGFLLAATELLGLRLRRRRAEVAAIRPTVIPAKAGIGYSAAFPSAIKHHRAP
jgi:hypothetical protein